MQQPIKVNYKSTNVPYTAIQWLRGLPDLIACDFETAIKYTPEQLAAFQAELETDPPKLRAVELRSKLAATALDHPSHVTITHLSVAWSESDSFVIILDTPRITDIVTNFLVTTTKTQIWHNASYDFRHLHYRTGKFPPNYEDSQLRAKCIVNHVDILKAKTGLKDLAGQWYGQWAVAAENFSLANIYDENLIHYAAIDSCATYKLFHSIGAHVENSSQ
jgi:hypothetical protein